MIWGLFSSYWGLDNKVSINGDLRTITVHSDVTELDIQADVYTSWVEWLKLDDNTRFALAIRYSGLDLIPGGVTGGIFFLMNNWKLVYNPQTVGINGVLYSENYSTAYFTYDGFPVYPAKASALVLQAQRQEVDLNSNDVAQAVWSHTSRTVTQKIATPSDVIAAVFAK